MALETLTGSTYINALNSSWPLGSDPRSQGDDHLRGIKNVLKNSFPSVSGPVTRTHTSLSTGSVPLGSIIPFFQAAAPTGWTRLAGINNTQMMRVVPTATAGGAFGGSYDPVLNNVVAAHTHTYSATTSNTSLSHTHTFSATSSGQSVSHFHAVGSLTIVENGNHNHTYQSQPSTSSAAAGTAVTSIATGSTTSATSTAGAHTHSITGNTNYGNADHNHSISGTTGAGGGANHNHTISGTTAQNGAATSWTPRYIDVILCQRTS
jgi:hypothetical protein